MYTKLRITLEEPGGHSKLLLVLHTELLSTPHGIGLAVPAGHISDEEQGSNISPRHLNPDGHNKGTTDPAGQSIPSAHAIPTA